VRLRRVLPIFPSMLGRHCSLATSLPLPGARRRGCDHKAIWTFVPAPRPEALSVLIYLHGNNNAVPVDSARPGGRAPDWAPKRTGSALRSAHGPLVPGAPVAAGPKYAMDTAAQTSAQRPVVLVPEDVIPSTGAFWAVGAAGTLGCSPPTWQHGRRLLPAPQPPAFSFRRAPILVQRTWPASAVFSWPDTPAVACRSHPPLPAHSLSRFRRISGCMTAPMAQHAIPVTSASASTGKHAACYGNDARSSRMAIFVTPDPRTTSVAADIIHTLRKPFSAAGRRFPGLTYARLTRAGLSPSVPRVDIVEAMPDATVAQVETALRTSPVVFVHTGVAHDHIPLVWTPRLLNTAAVL